MKKTKTGEQPAGEIKPDLKHDTMEFSAATEGDDKLDFDDETYEEEEISTDELDSLEDDTVEEQEYAQVAAEADRAIDEDNLPEEDWLEDIPGDKGENEEEQHLRKKKK